MTAKEIRIEESETGATTVTTHTGTETCVIVFRCPLRHIVIAVPDGTSQIHTHIPDPPEPCKEH